MSNHILENIQSIRQHSQNVKILAVSKTKPTDAILAAHQAGIFDFGENYVQEAIPKIEELKHYPLIWHYIGRLQANKCKKIAQNFDWVQTIDNFALAEKLNKANLDLAKTQHICIQVNLFGEEQKAGISPQATQNLVEAVLKLPQLKLQGLMTILPEHLSCEEQYQAYQNLKKLLIHLNHTLHLNLSTLSMGMSQDYREAIKAGSTMIRLGQAIFGPRTQKDKA
jgi:pyridoxal phosphate enzyme (YggS family)